MSEQSSDLHAEVAELRSRLTALEQKLEQAVAAIERHLGGGDDDDSVSFPAGGPGP
jgi:outer membrane protein TolC